MRYAVACVGLAWAGLVLAGSVSANAQAPASGGAADVDTGQRFRIVFAAHVGSLPPGGDLARLNEAAIERTERAIARWERHGHVRFVLVASRAAVCRGLPGCNAETLSLERTFAVRKAVLAAAQRHGRAIAPGLISEQFVETLPKAAALPEVQIGLAAIDVRIDLRPLPSDACESRLLVIDPELPPFLQSVGSISGVPVGSGMVVVRSNGMRLRHLHGAGPASVGVLENAKRELRRADASLQQATGMPLPTGALRVHLLKLDADRKALRLWATLSDEFRDSGGLADPSAVALLKRRTRGPGDNPSYHSGPMIANRPHGPGDNPDQHKGLMVPLRVDGAAGHCSVEITDTSVGK